MGQRTCKNVLCEPTHDACTANTGSMYALRIEGEMIGNQMVDDEKERDFSAVMGEPPKTRPPPKIRVPPIDLSRINAKISFD